MVRRISYYYRFIFLFMDFKVRKAKQADAEDLAKLFIEFWKVHQPMDPLMKVEKEFLALERQIKEIKKGLKKKNTYFFVAVKDNKVIGFVSFMIQKSEDYFQIKKYGYSDAAVIARQYRGKGVFPKIVKAGLEFLKSKGIKYISIDVYNQNKRALDAWQNLGFKPICTFLIKKI